MSSIKRNVKKKLGLDRRRDSFLEIQPTVVSLLSLKTVKARRPPSPKATSLNPLKLACEKETVTNHDPLFTVERNSLKQI